MPEQIHNSSAFSEPNLVFDFLPMIRRSHKKSRRGCTQCKRSHKKVMYSSTLRPYISDVQWLDVYALPNNALTPKQCDESQPICLNCKTGAKECSFVQKTTSSKSKNGELEFITSNQGQVNCKTPTSVVPDSSSLGERVTPSLTEPYVNLLHLELFQNIIMRAGSMFSRPHTELWINTVLKVS
jgi:hypothetical protein